MGSRLLDRHFTGNGYGFDGPWRHSAQRNTATKEALFICREWIEGRENLNDYRDAVEGLFQLYGKGVRPACRLLWAASLDRVRAVEEERLAYYDAGMDILTRYFRRHEGLQVLQTGWEHHNHQDAFR